MTFSLECKFHVRATSWHHPAIRSEPIRACYSLRSAIMRGQNPGDYGIIPVMNPLDCHGFRRSWGDLLSEPRVGEALARTATVQLFPRREDVGEQGYCRNRRWGECN